MPSADQLQAGITKWAEMFAGGLAGPLCRMVNLPATLVRRSHIVIDRARVIAVTVQPAPTRVVPRINIRAAEMQSILRSHIMIAAEGSRIRALRSAIIIRCRGTSKNHQKCRHTGNPGNCHDNSPLSSQEKSFWKRNNRT
jgi:hypothetical protein